MGGEFLGGTELRSLARPVGGAHTMETAAVCGVLLWLMQGAWGVVKTWEPRPLAWPDVACTEDRLLFSPLVAELPSTLELPRETVLPLDGVLLLPLNFSMRLRENQGSCAGRDIEVPFRPPAHWMDPHRWSQPAGGSAVPDAERVPCPRDDVVIPPGDQLAVDRGDVLVRSLTIGREPFTMQQFAEALRTPEGQLFFPNSGPVRVEEVACDDQTGCMCGNDRPEVLVLICGLAGPQCPSRLPCADPIHPRGHCCLLCGSSLLLRPEPGFLFSDLDSLMQRSLARDASVQGYMFKTSNSLFQITLTDDRGSRGRAARLAGWLQDQLDSGRYKVTSLEARHSLDWQERSGGGGGLSAGGSVGLVAGLLIAAALAFFGAKRLRDRLAPPGFGFARFDRTKEELELGTTPHDELDPAFDNPGYQEAEQAMEEKPAE